jgi:hypothetical protein
MAPTMPFVPGTLGAISAHLPGGLTAGSNWTTWFIGLRGRLVKHRHFLIGSLQYLRVMDNQDQFL